MWSIKWLKDRCESQRNCISSFHQGSLILKMWVRSIIFVCFLGYLLHHLSEHETTHLWSFFCSSSWFTASLQRSRTRRDCRQSSRPRCHSSQEPIALSKRCLPASQTACRLIACSFGCARMKWLLLIAGDCDCRMHTYGALFADWPWLRVPHATRPPLSSRTDSHRFFAPSSRACPASHACPLHARDAWVCCAIVCISTVVCKSMLRCDRDQTRARARTRTHKHARAHAQTYAHMRIACAWTRARASRLSYAISRIQQQARRVVLRGGGRDVGERAALRHNMDRNKPQKPQ